MQTDFFPTSEIDEAVHWTRELQNNGVDLTVQQVPGGIVVVLT